MMMAVREVEKILGGIGIYEFASNTYAEIDG
jgi:hypothetical protein